MAQEVLTGGLPMVSDPQSPFTFDLKKWLDEHGFAPDTNINKDANGNVTKNGVPYTPTPEESKILNTPPHLFPGFPDITKIFSESSTAGNVIFGFGILALVLLMFKK